MKEKHLTNGEAVGIGCIVSIGAFTVALVLFGWYMNFVFQIFIRTAFPLIIIGAFIGKYLTSTRVGTWLGAALGAILGYWWFFSIASKLTPD